MILTKEVEVKLGTHNISYYENLGYKIPREYDNKGRLRVIRGQSLLVKIDDLKKTSKEIIEIQCDECGDVFTIPYCQYNNLKEENKNLCYSCKNKIKWSYNIGESIIKDHLNITIIDRKMIDSNQYYKIKCNICGFNSGKHFNSKIQKYKEEYWITNSNLKKMKNCPCCQGKKEIIVKGINDISTTDPWMIPYFKNKEDLYIHSSTSGAFVDMRCPECGIDKGLYQICALKNIGYLPCICRKECSIPNKISYYVLKKLEDNNQISNYKREYSPNWIGLHSYDNYFTINNKKYIIEMDGGFHFNDNQMNGQSVEETKSIDDYKDSMAKEHNIDVIRVVAPDGKYHETYINLLNELSKIVDTSIIFENEIMENVHQNFVKVICDYYDANKSKTMNSIAKHFNIHIYTLRDYLKFGKQYGWCSYENQNTKHMNDRERAIEMHLNGIGNRAIAKELGLHERTIIKYVNQERIKGNIEYSIEEDALKSIAKNKGKKVYIYSKELELLKTYNSTGEAERESFKDFGVTFRSRSISRVCLGQREYYYDYKFSYVPLN